jgi:lipase
MSYGQRVASAVRENVVQLIGGPKLAIRDADGPLRPFLLVHDAGADAGSWDDVAPRLRAAGHQVAAVDLRGHGHSQAPLAGYDTDTCADDLSTLLDQLGFTGARSAVVVGHGWGANVVLSLAARRDGVAAVCCLDGGWTRPAWRFSSFEACWAALGPAPTQHLDDVALERRRSIVRSLYLGEPRAWYPLITVPVVLCPVLPPDGRPDPSGNGAATRTGVAEATARLPSSRVSWYYGGPDVLAADPARIADDLLALVTAAEPLDA